MSARTPLDSSRVRVLLRPVFPATPASLARILCWIAGFLVVFLLLTSEADRRSRASVGTDSKGQRPLIFRSTPAAGSQSGLDEEFVVALIGSSECADRFQRGKLPLASLAESLLAAVPDTAAPKPTVMDFSGPGITLWQRMPDVKRAVELGADAVVVTFAYHSLQDIPLVLPGGLKLKTLISGPQVRDRLSASKIPAMALSNPARKVDQFLAGQFPSYQNRFASTVGPIARPDLFFIEQDIALGPTIPPDSFFCNWFERSGKQLEELIASEGTLRPALEYIVEPAKSQGVPVLMVLTPVDRAVLTPEGLKTLSDAEAFVQSDSGASVSIFSALRRYDAGSSIFRDPAHLNDFRELGSELLGELVRRGAVPKSWGPLESTAN